MVESVHGAQIFIIISIIIFIISIIIYKVDNLLYSKINKLYYNIYKYIANIYRHMKKPVQNYILWTVEVEWVEIVGCELECLRSSRTKYNFSIIIVFINIYSYSYTLCIIYSIIQLL